LRCEIGRRRSEVATSRSPERVPIESLDHVVRSNDFCAPGAQAGGRRSLWRRRDGSGRAFRSLSCIVAHERPAVAAHARSTVAAAIKALEDAGVLSWAQRSKRVREPCPDLLGADGWRWRVLRTSNSNAFTDPSPAADRPNPSKSEKPIGTPIQDFLFNKERATPTSSVDFWSVAESFHPQ
jgi:hypothetical protein